MLKMVDFIEFFMLPSSEFQLMTLIKNIGGDGHLILGYIYTRYIYTTFDTAVCTKPRLSHHIVHIQCSLPGAGRVLSAGNRAWKEI